MKRKFFYILIAVFISLKGVAQTKFETEIKINPIETKNMFYVFGGVNLSKEFYPNGLEQITNHSPAGLTPIIGIGADCGLNKKKWRAGVELYHQQVSTNIEFDNAHLKENVNYLHINGHMKYTFSYNRIQPFIKFGLGVAQSFSENRTITPTGSEATTTRHNYYNTEKFIFTAIGLRKNNFIIESRFELANNFGTIYNPNGLLTSNFGLSLGYVFAGR